MPFPNKKIQVGDQLSESFRSFSTITDVGLIKELCITKIPGWKEIETNNIEVSQILSGLTNQLFSVSIIDGSISSSLKHSKVLFRIYGKHVGKFYDSKVELQVFRYLSEINIAPKLIADFPEGRIEEFLEGEPLTTNQLKLTHICTEVAKNLGYLHTINTKRADFPKTFDKEPILFKRIYLWKEEAISQMSKENFSIDQELYRTILNEVYELENIILGGEKLSFEAIDTLSSVTPAYSLVFAHNDLQENNLLQTSNNIRMIDYEYSAVNFAASDIANFFCEFTYNYCHDKPPFFKYNYDDYPSEELRKLFISVYLSQTLQKQILPSDDVVQVTAKVIEVFCLASHLSWGFWSIARTPGYQPNSVEFDFSSYTNIRFSHYLKKKKQLIEEGIIPLNKWLIK
ncbi:choline kinase GmCK2p-like protein [Cryptosporidium ryanae]|uniref:choline kinase GmCK2p-like protein n=1 Tax=Cryptosporidium ryanae TaxID=515981 RepID=UPI00351A2E54|nr:choline kinase GmCK2p-like protein [Cryptosporidium ryanae]